MRAGARWASATALLLPLSLAGCAGLATSSEVRAEQPISNAAVPNLDVAALPPLKGQSAKEIVRYFLLAGVSLDDDFGVARKYLTTQASTKWVPQDGATITTGEADYRVSQAAGKVTVSATRQATLDARGHVAENVPVTSKRATFGVAKVEGEWRISSLPAGFSPWISDVDFRRVFSPRPIYYPAANRKVLVPDVQWYPDTGLATAVARAVLASPPVWLRQSVRGADTPGIRLAINAVPVDQNTGVATIDLSPSALSADGPTRLALWAAMTATLTTVPSVTRVELTVNGNRLAATGLPAEPLTVSDLGYQLIAPGGAGLIARRGGSLTWKRPGVIGSSRPSGDPDKPPEPLPSVAAKYYAIAADRTGSSIAALSTDRRSVEIWTMRSARSVPTFAGNLTRPSFTGKVALVAGISGTGGRDDTTGAGVWAIDTATKTGPIKARRLSTPWLQRSNVISAKVSPEGVRVAMILRGSDGGSTLMVAGLLRNANGVPIGISKPVPVPVGIDSIIDVAWSDDSSLIVLGGKVGVNGRTVGNSEIAQVPLSGQSDTFDAPSGLQEVVATATGPGDVFVLDHQGGVWLREGANWVRQSEIDDVAAPGA